eukprot:4256348-Prymnesium_polylepis.1
MRSSLLGHCTCSSRLGISQLLSRRRDRRWARPTKGWIWTIEHVGDLAVPQKPDAPLCVWRAQDAPRCRGKGGGNRGRVCVGLGRCPLGERATKQ